MPKKYSSKTIGILELKSLRNDQMHFCNTTHQKREMNKQATHSVFIMGQPAGYLCKPCMNDWMVIWESILTQNRRGMQNTMIS